MGHGRGKSASYTEPTPTPVLDYNVTGPITPDATCNYSYAGMYNNKPYYRRLDGLFFLWWYAPGLYWMISPGLGDLSFYWSKRNDPMTGEYEPHEIAEGTATVSAGPH